MLLLHDGCSSMVSEGQMRWWPTANLRCRMAAFSKSCAAAGSLAANAGQGQTS